MPSASCPGVAGLSTTGEERGLDSRVIMVSAYYDGPGVSPDGALFPAANDNASGVAVMLEMARQLKNSPYQPKRTVVFTAWAEGERGAALSLSNVMNAKAGFGLLRVDAVHGAERPGRRRRAAAWRWARGPASGSLQLYQDAAGRFGLDTTTRGRGPHFGSAVRAGFGGPVGPVALPELGRRRPPGPHHRRRGRRGGPGKAAKERPGVAADPDGALARGGVLMLETWRNIMTPAGYHGQGRRPPFFEGWYFKLVDPTERHRLAIIPGIYLAPDATKTHAFVQLLDGATGRSAYRQHPAAEFACPPDELDIRLGANRFTGGGLSVDVETPGFQRSRRAALRPAGALAGDPGLAGHHGLVCLDALHGVLPRRGEHGPLADRAPVRGRPRRGLYRRPGLHREGLGPLLPLGLGLDADQPLRRAGRQPVGLGGHHPLDRPVVSRLHRRASARAGASTASPPTPARGWRR